MDANAMSLDSLRERSLRLVLTILWVQIPLTAGVCWLSQTSAVFPIVTVAALAAVCEGVARFGGTGRQTRVIAGVSFMAAISVMVAAAAGQKMQVDLHMYYFAGLALLVAPCDWLVVAAAAATVAVHHLALNVLIPSLIYPGRTDWLRFAIHAAILVVEAAVLVWVARTVEAMFDRVRKEASDAAGARVVAEESLGRAFDAAQEADSARRLRDTDQARTAADDALTLETLGTALSKLAGGDLTCRIESDMPAKALGLRDDFNAALAKLGALMRSISDNAEATRMNAAEISSATDDLSRRTEQQAAGLEETAAALDQVTGIVRNTATNAEHGRRVALHAKAAAETSETVVLRAAEAMTGIQASSREIGQIIGVIDEIAFQTNLLALNAGVEAARAGDAGRGFAVVASEVRALAQRSAEAAKEIKTLISSSAQQVDAGVGLVDQTVSTLKDIIAKVMEINGVVDVIVGSTQEQARALGEVNGAIGQMDRTTQQNAAMVEQTSAASQQLSRQVSSLSDLIGSFKVDSADGLRAHAPRSGPATGPARRQSFAA